MELPDFLNEVGGEIRLTGSRIGLMHVVDLYNDGCSVEKSACEFPTLTLAQIQKTVAFHLENRDEVDS